MITYSTRIEDYRLEKTLEISIGQTILSFNVECDFEVNNNLQVSELGQIYLFSDEIDSEILSSDDLLYAVIKKAVYENLLIDKNFKQICLEKLAESTEE